MNKNIKIYNVYSSFLFFTNYALAYYYDYYIYSLFFLMLLITSVIYHSSPPNYTIYILDKLAILSIVLYGMLLCYMKINLDNIYLFLIILFAFILTFYLYYYGKIKNKYCFSKNKNSAIKYHSLLHIISSVAHNMIILL